MKQWKRKPRILLVGDSSCIHTGFARIIKNVALHLYNTGEYEVKTIGWFHKETEEIVPYEIFTTDQTDRMRMEMDKYAAHTFPKVVEKYKPDLVLCVGDSWMVEHTAIGPARNEFKYKLILYVPIDGMPIPKKWTDTFAKADVTVLYGDFGKKVVTQRNPGLTNLTTINHAVDLDIFKPIEEDARKEMKKQFGGENKFIVGCVARNQPRKYLPRLFKTARLFLNGYTVCSDCGELRFEISKQCQACESVNVVNGEPKEDVRFYMHMALNDCGWNIYELIQRFGLSGKIAYPRGLQVGHGVEIHRLAEIMASFDVFTLPTSGEGWGLPILEAMACGTPVVVTDYSAHVDFVKGAGELIKVSEFMTEPLTNIERAVVDLFDYCMRLDRLYYNDSDVFWTKWGKYINENYGWPKESVIVGDEYREVLSGLSRARAKGYSWERVNSEWQDLINLTLDYTPKTGISEDVSGPSSYGTEEL